MFGAEVGMAICLVLHTCVREGHWKEDAVVPIHGPDLLGNSGAGGSLVTTVDHPVMGGSFLGAARKVR